MLDEKEEGATPCWPLAETREQDEIDRKTRDEPTNLTKTETLLDEEYNSKRRGKTPEEQCELDKALTQREWLILEIVLVKHILNGMKLRYKEELAQQQEAWKKWKKEVNQIEEKEWFKSLTEEHKAQARTSRYEQAWFFLSLQNEILERTGNDLTVMSRLLETDFIYEHPLV